MNFAFSGVFSSVHVDRYIFVYEEKELGIIVLNMLGVNTQNSLWWAEGRGVNTEANSASTQNVVARRVLQDGYTIQIFLPSGDLLCKYLFSIELTETKWFMYENASPDKCLTR